MHCDLLLKPRWIVPIEPAGVVLEGHVLAVHDGRIAALVPAAEAAHWTATQCLELPAQLVHPSRGRRRHVGRRHAVLRERLQKVGLERLRRRRGAADAQAASALQQLAPNVDRAARCCRCGWL